VINNCWFYNQHRYYENKDYQEEKNRIRCVCQYDVTKRNENDSRVLVFW